MRRGMPSYPERVVVRSGNELLFVNVRDVDWFGAADNYVELHVGPTTHLLRETLTGIEHRLDPRAIGRDFLGAPGQAGSPLLGITCRRGIEVHLLGFSAGASSGSLVTPFGRLPGRLK